MVPFQTAEEGPMGRLDSTTRGLGPHDAVIVSYARTPFGRARKGTLATERPEDLGTAAIRAAIDRTPELDPS